MKKKTHTDINLTIEGAQFVCEVPRRYLNQVAGNDGIHTDRDYVDIALANIEAVKTAAKTKLELLGSGKRLRLERSDFPAKA